MPEKQGRGRPKLNPIERKAILLQVRMPSDLIAALKRAAQAEGIPLSVIVRERLEEWLRRRK